jgi:hypothetical protein
MSYLCRYFFIFKYSRSYSKPRWTLSNPPHGKKKYFLVSIIIIANKIICSWFKMCLLSRKTSHHNTFPVRGNARVRMCHRNNYKIPDAKSFFFNWPLMWRDMGKTWGTNGWQVTLVGEAPAPSLFCWPACLHTGICFLFLCKALYLAHGCQESLSPFSPLVSGFMQIALVWVVVFWKMSQPTCSVSYKKIPPFPSLLLSSFFFDLWLYCLTSSPE